MNPSPETKNKLEALKKRLAGYSSVAIAFSGGVDSTFLLAVAAKSVPGRVLAVTVASPLTPDGEVRDSYEMAMQLGIEQIVTGADDLVDIDVFRDNPPDRCYYCKQHFFAVVLDVAQEIGLDFVLEASNADDVDDYRPGLRAVKELGIMSPLLEAGLTKAEIRALSKEMGLPTWDKPAMACLASRVPYGEEITREKLLQIEQGEEMLFKESFRLYRLRHHGTLARIEVPLEDIERLRSIWPRIEPSILGLGFERVEIDPRGYRTGSLNEGIDAALESRGHRDE
jgi:uncharacterized protein